MSKNYKKLFSLADFFLIEHNLLFKDLIIQVYYIFCIIDQLESNSIANGSLYQNL